MDSFIVSARKYRPARFEDVIGQPQVTHTLKNAIRQNQVAQAFLFCGPRGVGKTTCARILAKVINCENISEDLEACNECASCKSFNENASFNVHELDAASNNSVDDIRSLIDQVRYAPQAGKKKIYIIDEVHMLSQAAFNAFLKTLEEPPPYAIFILATTEKHRIIPTILSRCQIFDFNRIKVEDMANYLATIAKRENIKAEPDALHIIAQKADGALRDALSIFDRISIFSNGNISYPDVLNNLNVLDYDYFFRMTDSFLQEDISTSLLTLNEIFQKGFEGDNFLSGLGEHFRSLLVCKDPVTLQLLETSENLKNRYRQQAKYTPQSFLLTGLTLINQGELNLRSSRNKRLAVELVLMKLSYMLSAIKATKNTAPAAEVKKNLTPESVKEFVTTSSEKKESYNTTAAPKEKSTPPSPVKEINIEIPSSLDDLKKKVSQTKSLTESTERQPVTDYETIDVPHFNVVFRKYLEQLQKEEKFPVLDVLQSYPPEIIDNKTILITVSNQTYYNFIAGERDNMIEFLKRELEKKSVNLTFNIDKSVSKSDTGKRPYTPQEKYDFLVQKNPKIKDLKDKLKLELDF